MPQNRKPRKPYQHPNKKASDPWQDAQRLYNECIYLQQQALGIHEAITARMQIDIPFDAARCGELSKQLLEKSKELNESLKAIHAEHEQFTTGRIKPNELHIALRVGSGYHNWLMTWTEVITPIIGEINQILLIPGVNNE